VSGDRIRFRQALFLPVAGTQRANAWQPSVDVYQIRGGGWLVKFDLAGVRREDITLTASGKRLTLQGVRHDAVCDESCRHYRMEISYSRFERSIELPIVVDPQRVRTDYRDGMLLVYIQGETNK
jgi:HSP20 family protein